MQDILGVASQLNPWWLAPGDRLHPLEPWKRTLQGRVLAHLVSEPRRAALVLGPRQVGKSVILLQCVDDLIEQGWPPTNITYFDFSDERLIGAATSPRTVADFKPPGFDENQAHILLLDEVARADHWAEWLKQVVDRRSHRVLATDSAAARLSEGSRESGVGRWDEYFLEGLTYPEFLSLLRRGENETPEAVEKRLPDAFEGYLARGGFPGYARTESLRLVRQLLRRDIAGRVVGQDLVHARVDTVRVAALLQYLLESSGTEFNASKIAEDLGSDSRSVAKWASVLEATMLLARLDNRGSARARLKQSSHPKYYARDHGLIHAFSTAPDPTADSRARGQVFEAVVYRHIRELETSDNISVHFLRTQEGKAEVDFVVETAGGPTVAIEVTSSADPRGRKMQNVKARAREIGAARRLVVYGGVQPREHDGVELVPLRDFALNTGDWVIS